MSSAAFVPVGSDTEAPLQRLSQQARYDATSVGTGMSPQGSASTRIKLESFVLLLTALLTLVLMASIATQF